MSSMNIVDVPIDTLKLADYNPRRLSQHNFESLQRSLDSFGWVEPVVVNKRNNTIVGGHQRVRAARELGQATVPVTYVDLDEAKERSLNVALNKISGEFDNEMLQELLVGLEDEDRILTGFSDDEILALQDGYVEFDNEGKPEAPKTTKYSLDELKSLVASYPYNEHATILRSFINWLGERENNQT